MVYVKNYANSLVNLAYDKSYWVFSTIGEKTASAIEKTSQIYPSVVGACALAGTSYALRLISSTSVDGFYLSMLLNLTLAGTATAAYLALPKGTRSFIESSALNLIEKGLTLPSMSLSLPVATDRNKLIYLKSKNKLAQGWNKAIQTIKFVTQFSLDKAKTIPTIEHTKKAWKHLSESIAGITKVPKMNILSLSSLQAKLPNAKLLNSTQNLGKDLNHSVEVIVEMTRQSEFPEDGIQNFNIDDFEKSSLTNMPKILNSAQNLGKDLKTSVEVIVDMRRQSEFPEYGMQNFNIDDFKRSFLTNVPKILNSAQNLGKDVNDSVEVIIEMTHQSEFPEDGTQNTRMYSKSNLIKTAEMIRQRVVKKVIENVPIKNFGSTLHNSIEGIVKMPRQSEFPEDGTQNINNLKKLCSKKTLSTAFKVICTKAAAQPHHMYKLLKHSKMLCTIIGEETAKGFNWLSKKYPAQLGIAMLTFTAYLTNTLINNIQQMDSEGLAAAHM